MISKTDNLSLNELSESRFLKLSDSLVGLMLLGHLGFLGLFMYLDITGMMLVNLCFSVPVLSFSYFLIKTKRLPRLRIILPILELIIHSIIAIYLLSWDTGFYFYIIASIVAIQLYPWKLRSKLAIAVLLTLVSISIYFFHFESQSPLENILLDSFFVMNLIGAIVYLTTFILFQLSLSHELERKLFSSNADLEEINDLISQQKTEIEEQHKEIKDSITYAQRIQGALLPTSKRMKEHLKKSFLLYKPKDIVAGDFYWLEPTEKGVLFAAADCTGHGVPGAIVSVICNASLNRSVREFGLTEPGEILDKTRELVIQEFENSEEEVKDGMDIAICKLHNYTLSYAGANNPLWIIPEGSRTIEAIIEYKADKQPIGKYVTEKPFVTNTIKVNKGDSIYLFSDGFVDQFGGEKGKKFKAKAFRSLLISVQEKPMEEQKRIIDSTFENWKGELEQVDDVCVIGVKL